MNGVETFAWNMGWEDWAGNFCYLILAVSYLVTNLYWLRLLAILALGLEGIYFYCASTPPLWVGIAWAVVFVAINLIQIALLTRERLKVEMSGLEILFHQRFFLDVNRLGSLFVAVNHGGYAAFATDSTGGSLACPIARFGRQRERFAHVKIRKSLAKIDCFMFCCQGTHYGKNGSTNGWKFRLYLQNQMGLNKKRGFNVEKPR